MNRNLFGHCFFKPGGLYAPQGRQSTSEKVLCSDRIGVACTATGEALELLSSALFFLHRSVIGIRSGSVGRFKPNKQNTVLLRLTFDPVEHLPICPRRYRFAKTLSPIALLAVLEIE